MSQIFNLIFNSYVTCRTDSKHRNICTQHTDHGSTPTRLAGAYTYLGGACVSQLEGGRWTRQPRFGGVAPGGSHRPSGGVGPEGRRICGDGDELPAEPVAGGRRRRSAPAQRSGELAMRPREKEVVRWRRGGQCQDCGRRQGPSCPNGQTRAGMSLEQRSLQRNLWQPTSTN
jgi:hypothetical protein